MATTNPRHLPSIIALQCFEAAAGSLSFTQAGEALNLTQSAVSRQIKTLEQNLGVVLFDRVKQRLELTSAGKAYAAEVTAVLAQLRRAGAAVAAKSSPTRLKVGAESALVTRWLMPVLNEFTDSFPDVDIEMVTDLSQLYQHQSGFEVGILFGDGQWSGFKATRLMNETLVAVCAPPLKDIAVKNKAEIERWPLLHQRSSLSASEIWWHSLGYDDKTIEAMPGQRYENFPMLRDAAVQGLGVAILPQYFVQKEMTEGTLVSACDENLICEQAYYLVRPLAEEGGIAQHFSQWILSKGMQFNDQK